MKGGEKKFRSETNRVKNFIGEIAPNPPPPPNFRVETLGGERGIEKQRCATARKREREVGRL